MNIYKKTLAIISIIIISAGFAQFNFEKSNPIKTEAGPQTYNINTSAVSGFGSSNVNEQINATKILTDKSVLIGGKLDISQNFGKTPIVLNGGGKGFLSKLDRTGQTIQKIIRFTDEVGEIELSSNGNIVVVSLTGLFVFDSNLDNILWQKTITTTSGSDNFSAGIDVAPNGNIAVLYNKTLQAGKNIKIFSPIGTELLSKIVLDTRVEDVAIDNNNFYYTGFNQKDGGQCGQLQSPYIRAFDLNGNFVWKAYDWTQTESGTNSFGVNNSSANNCGDTRGRRLEIAPSGKIIFTATSDGGNTVLRWKGNKLWEGVPSMAQDYSSNPAAGAARTSTIVILDNLGNVERTAVNSSRLTNAKGNSFSIEAVDIDENNEIYVSGTSAAYLQSRNPCTNTNTACQQSPGLSIDGILLNPYWSYEGFVMQMAPNLENKRYLTTFNGFECTSTNKSISAYKGMVVSGGSYNGVAKTVNGVSVMGSCPKMMTHNPIQEMNQGGTDGYFAVFGDTSDESCSNSATNPPTCNTCVEWQKFVGNACAYNVLNQDPTVSFANIVPNQQFVLGQDIEIKLNYNDPENLIRKIKLVVETGDLIQYGGPFNTPQYSFVWTGNNTTRPQTLGVHRLSASIQDESTVNDTPLYNNRSGITTYAKDITFEIIAPPAVTSSSTSSSIVGSSTISSNTPLSSISSLLSSSSNGGTSTAATPSSNSIFSSSISSSILSSSYSSSSNSSASCVVVIPQTPSCGNSSSSSILSNSVISSSSIFNSSQSNSTLRTYVVQLADNKKATIEIQNPVCQGLSNYGETTINSIKLIQFQADCNSIQIKTYWTDLDPNQNYEFKKYNSTIGQIIPNFPATITRELKNGINTIVSTHSINDNQLGDSDNLSNKITDPYTLVPLTSVNTGGVITITNNTPINTISIKSENSTVVSSTLPQNVYTSLEPTKPITKTNLNQNSEQGVEVEKLSLVRNPNIEIPVYAFNRVNIELR